MQFQVSLSRFRRNQMAIIHEPENKKLYDHKIWIFEKRGNFKFYWIVSIYGCFIVILGFLDIDCLRDEIFFQQTFCFYFEKRLTLIDKICTSNFLKNIYNFCVKIKFVKKNKSKLLQYIKDDWIWIIMTFLTLKTTL